jgi:tetratricopeptide (TPR) repeat protein
MTTWKFCRSFSGIVLRVLLLVCKAEAEDTWTEVRSPHFRVLTNGSVQQGRNAAASFEQMRHVFAVEFSDEAIGAGAPLTIVAARDSGTFKMLAPTEWKRTGGNVGGEFQRGWEKQFATVILDSFSQSEIVVFHEYTHSILHARAHWLPVWLDEGLAEFYGYTRFEESRTLIGTPSVRMGALRGEFLLPVSEMLDTKNETQLIRDARKANLFYAEAWAMAHYMMFGPGMGNGAKLNMFFKKLQDGEPEKAAFKEIFGDTKAFDNALSQYVRSFGFNAGAMPADAKVDAKSFPTQKLTPAETEYELGAFQIGTHESKLGRARIEHALALDPKLAGAHEELAFLEFREGKDDEAVKEWQQAVDLDPTKARSVFALAMSGVSLDKETIQQKLAMQKTLQHVIELSPRFAPAYVELALLEWRLGQLQQAYIDAQKAEQMEPWRAGYRVLAGRIMLAGHQPVLAAKTARYVAERWHGPDHNEAVDLWNEVPANDRGEGAPLALEMPLGAKVERGTLTSLTCGNAPGEPMTLTVLSSATGAEPLTIKSNGNFEVGFSDSFWWGEDHFTTCHHLTGHTAIIAYKPVGHELLDLEVRDDLPATATPVTPAVASSHN